MVSDRPGGTVACEGNAPQLRILHVVPTFYPATFFGGPIQSVYGLCNALAQQVDLRVLTTDSAGANARDRFSVVVVPEQMPAGYDVYYCAKTSGREFSWELLRRLGPLVRWADVVHLTGVYSFTTIPTLLVARVLGKPVVWSPRGALQRWPESRRVWLKALWDRFCRIVAPARAILHVTSHEEGAESALRLPGLKAVMIPNGVDMPAPVSRTPSSGQLRLLFIGRLDPKKGVENLIEACRMVQGRLNRGWSLVIAGSGHSSYEGSLKACTEEKGVAGQVQFVGHVDGHRKTALFAEADILILPSFTENFGLVVAEALAHGVPVITSTHTPWKRVEEMQCGLWVDNDPEALVKALERMAVMPLAEMGARGREWMRREFSWTSVARAILERYHLLADAPGGL